MSNNGEKNIFVFILKIFILFIIIWLQILAIKYIYLGTQTISIYAKNIFEILKICLILRIIYKDQQISYKLTWSILILLFPVFGILVYAIFGNNKLPKKVEKRINLINNEINEYLVNDTEILNNIKNENIIKYNQVRYLKNTVNLSVYNNTQTKYLKNGEEYFKCILEDIKKAKKYILIEYFIISNSEMWNKLYDELNKKANEGVKIYILYDYLGSATRLPKHLKKINSNIKVKAFNPVIPIIYSYLNYRDHRKITVIDGEIAYTGGINIGDEYINLKSKYGYWKDTGVRLEGDATWNFVLMFFRMWKINVKEEIDYNFFKSSKKFNFDNGYVFPYCDSPYNLDNPAKNIYMNLINTTKNYIYITTPYLIIDDELLLAFSNLAKSGVDVRIIIPGIPDKKLVYLATKSFCTKLIKSGVKIYKYNKGFIHAKTLISDDENAIVGSVNFDFRSLYLNYEVATYMYRTNINNQMKEDYMNLINESEEILYKDICNKNIILRIVESILRIFSPLL